MADKIYFPGWRLSPDGKEYRLFDCAEDVPDGWLRETPESFAKHGGKTVVLGSDSPPMVDMGDSPVNEPDPAIVDIAVDPDPRPESPYLPQVEPEILAPADAALLATDGNEFPVHSPIKIDENLAGSDAERNIAPVAAPKPRGRPKKSLDL